MMKFYIGTSGWSYRHWKGKFFPSDLPSSQWLAYLSTIFNTVEINATFYRQPRPTTFQKWHDQTPAGFLFSVKASRFITHIRKLRDVREPVRRFYQAIQPLKEKVGCVLYQLPPSLRYDRSLIDSFLEQIDPAYRTTIEVRHPSFLTGAFFQTLREKNVALCWSDTAGRYPYSEEVTADFLYIRLHGSPVLYRSSYAESFLRAFGDKLMSIGRDAFVYFDNDAEGHAPENALFLKQHLAKP